MFQGCLSQRLLRDEHIRFTAASFGAWHDPTTGYPYRASRLDHQKRHKVHGQSTDVGVVHVALESPESCVLQKLQFMA